MAFDWYSALFGIVSVIIGSFLVWFFSQWNLIKPKFEIHFVFDKIGTLGDYFRLQIKNVGRRQAQNCVVKLKIYDNDNKLIQDYQILHWSRNLPILVDPKTYLSSQYSSINISSKDEELIDCFITIHDSKDPSNTYWAIYSYPFTENVSSFAPTRLPSGKASDSFKTVIQVNGDDAKPKTMTFYYKILLGKLHISVDNSSFREVEPYN